MKSPLLFVPVIGILIFMVISRINNSKTHDPEPKETKVYLISTIKYDENFIERAYLSAEKANEYVEMYRDHHDYQIQEVTIHE